MTTSLIVSPRMDISDAVVRSQDPGRLWLLAAMLARGRKLSAQPCMHGSQPRARRGWQQLQPYHRACMVPTYYR